MFLPLSCSEVWERGYPSAFNYIQDRRSMSGTTHSTCTVQLSILVEDVLCLCASMCMCSMFPRDCCLMNFRLDVGQIPPGNNQPLSNMARTLRSGNRLKQFHTLIYHSESQRWPWEQHQTAVTNCVKKIPEMSRREAQTLPRLPLCGECVSYYAGYRCCGNSWINPSSAR